MTDKLIKGLEQLNINASDKQKEQLEQYIQCVLEFNKSYNLMKAENADEMAVNHVLDSLAAVEHLQTIIDSIGKGKEVRIGDIGSGGGCPGIPLAIIFSEYKFTLVERMEKRCAFLESAIHKIQLTNTTVQCVQASTVKPQSFDLIVFRAFHPFDAKIVKTLMPMIISGGYIAAYKARAQKITEEMEGVKNLIPTYKKITLTVPFLEDHERNLVVIQKA